MVFTTMLVSILMAGCKHDSEVPSPTGGTGGNGGSTEPCSPNVIYFENQVLPILTSNCTESGCHNEQDKADGVVLTNYARLAATIEDFKDKDFDENELMKSLLETDPDKRMPYGQSPLSAAQIQLIGDWITQGALDNTCDASAGGCDLSKDQFNAVVKPIIDTHCLGCHSGANASGGINFSSYDNIKAQVTNGKLYASITRTANWMPKNSAKLNNCDIDRIKSWIDRGAPED